MTFTAKQIATSIEHARYRPELIDDVDLDVLAVHERGLHASAIVEWKKTISGERCEARYFATQNLDPRRR
jgi:hypothetical protein